MSNKHIESLTVRLLQALDKNYDVVNMDAVLSVIAALENTKITKEQLEATRLAKYINLFRRRTKSEQLAKRAKSLLKRWREMVGMQQRPLSSCTDLMRNESATSSNFQENINLVEAITPMQQSVDVATYTPVTRNAFSNSSTGDKIAEYHKVAAKIPAKTAPTSFSNVLAGFSGVSTDRSNPPSTNLNVANGPSVRRKNSNPKRNTDTSVFPDVFSFEQQSNVNSIANFVPNSASTKLSANTEPIIIDIEDSNSGSNLVDAAPRLKESEIFNVGSNNDVSEKPNKHKKTKKDKKRTRERENFQELSTPLVVIDAESSLSQQSSRKQEAPGSLQKALTSITDEKTRTNNLMVTNISEILSLSNSSMSSVFPTSSVGATKNLFSQQSNRPLSESDLSFAGKFAQENGPVVSPIAPPATTHSEKINFHSYNNAVDKTVTVSETANSFQPFTGTGCISNDSASNSRHSTFEVTDNNSQGTKTHQKRVDSNHSFSMHRPKFSSGKDRQLSPTERVSSGIVQTTTNLSTTNAPANQMPEQKVPKKRGRKKGSKGIDSLIAKDTSLSSQMLIQSLGNGTKKVKTTKELYAEMQNRKLGVSTPTTPSQWGGAQSQTFVRRDSFCSEPSLHSPRTFDACSTNATVSTIATSSTPEKSSLQRHTVDIDSGSDSLISGGQSHDSVALQVKSEKSTNLQKSSSPKVAIEESSKTCTLKVESQLRELVEKLPAVPSKEKIEMDSTNDTVACTCKIIEILPKEPDPESEVAAVGNLLSLDALSASNENVLKDDTEEPVITVNVGRMDTNDSKLTTSVTAEKERAIKTVSKRSIFDLDYEDDEDPLQTIIAEVAAAGGVSEKDEVKSNEAGTPSNEVKDFVQPEVRKHQEPEIHQYDGSQDQQLPSQEIPQTVSTFPKFKVEEDENCPAKQCFELKVQKITNFHIHALHNCYIPNVNGNWDDAIDKNNTKGENVTGVGEGLLTDGSNVVPNYCSFDSEEYIRKDLRDIAFDPNFKPKPRPKAVEKLFYQTPFLGVSRCLKNLKSSHRKTRKHREGFESKNEVSSNMPINETIENLKNLHNNVLDETNLLLADSPLNSAKDTETSHSQCNINENSAPVLDNITITVDKTMSPIIEESSPEEAHNLLAIATNVNFNNNQIEITTGENVTTEKSCAVKDEKGIENINLHAEKEGITFSTNFGDKRNNCKDKSEESSCESHSSLKQTQKSINLKLRKQRRQDIEQEQNSSKSYSKRKRRRKESSNRGKRRKIKCIKIAINGGIATQRHIKMRNSSDDDDSESDSYFSDSGESDTHIADDSSTENELIENCEVEKEFAYDESEWKRSKDTAASEHEYIDDDEEYEYDDDDDLEEEDEFSGEFHEVVTRDISPTSESGNNHIVLTIKKTPSKTNSPSGSIPPISPVVSGNKISSIDPTNTDKIEEETENISKKQIIEDVTTDNTENPQDRGSKITNIDAQHVSQTAPISINRLEMMTYAKLIQKYKLKPQFCKRKSRLLRRKSRECKSFCYPYDVKNKSDTEHIFRKQHQKLFFPHEIFEETSNGYKKRIFDMSSCESSCAEYSEYEYESLSDKDSKSDKRCNFVDANKYIKNSISSSDSDESSSSSSSSDEFATSNNSDEAVEETSEVKNNENHNTSDSDIESKEHANITMENKEVLPEDNNGLLVSFNKLCTPLSALEVSSDSVAKMKECDELCSKDCNNSENCGNTITHGVKADTSNIQAIANNANNVPEFKPLLEYSTGLRSVDNAVDDKDSNNCKQMQQFREWHQLLQLRSYNDELLTVLPYVVLD